MADWKARAMADWKAAASARCLASAWGGRSEARSACALPKELGSAASSSAGRSAWASGSASAGTSAWATSAHASGTRTVRESAELRSNHHSFSQCNG
jgi:hypothetical protein